MNEIPEGLYYSERHVWLKKTGEREAFVGITDFASKSLKEIVFVNFRCKEGDLLRCGDVFAELEAIKTVSDVCSPVGGKVVSLNRRLEEQPSVINKNPYTDGWLIKIKYNEDSEIGLLMNAEEYVSYIKT